MTLHIVLSGHGEVITPKISRTPQIQVPANTGIRFYVFQGVPVLDAVAGRVEIQPSGDHGRPVDEVRSRLRGSTVLEHVLYDPRSPNLDIHRSEEGALQFMATLDKAAYLSEFLTWLDGQRRTLVTLGFLGAQDEEIRVHWCACRVVATERPSSSRLRLGVGMRLCLCNQDFRTIAALQVRAPGWHEIGILR